MITKLRREESPEYRQARKLILLGLYKKYLEKCPKTAVQGNNVFYLTPRLKYKSTNEGMIPVTIVSVNGRKPETVIRSFSFVSYCYFHF